MNRARQLLIDAQARFGCLLSVGLEPCAEYLAPGFDDTPAGHRDYLRAIIAATADHAAAYKANAAFFEAMGTPGMALLEELRGMIPADRLFILDAKRGDIGTTALHYARAAFDLVRADAITINPLMGRDSAEPFLSYEDRLCFFLVLTSNPGANDFLMQDQLYMRLAGQIRTWDRGGNVGFVVGATRPSFVSDIRELAPDVPFLVPGVGAQGGDAEATLKAGRQRGPDAFSGVLFHATRSLLPGPSDAGRDVVEVIRTRTERLSALLRGADVQPH